MLEKINLATLNKKSPTESFMLLFGEINIENCAAAIEWILESNYSDSPPEVLNLFINSPGGDLHAAFSLIDFIRGSKIPIRTIGVGQLASAGLLIFTSGQKGFRILSENASIMSHTFSTGNIGSSHDLVDYVKEVDLITKRLIKHLNKCTGLSEKDVIAKLMPRGDVYLTTEEAVKLGLADSVKTLK
jgi:ATP-dependent Clp protease protease subunit